MASALGSLSFDARTIATADSYDGKPSEVYGGVFVDGCGGALGSTQGDVFVGRKSITGGECDPCCNALVGMCVPVDGRGCEDDFTELPRRSINKDSIMNNIIVEKQKN